MLIGAYGLCIYRLVSSFTMKLVFCDIDGVLNSNIGISRTGIAGVETDKLELLKTLVEETGAALVITSKARFAKTIFESRLQAIRDYGIPIEDVFQGNGLSSNPKAIEVLAYLQKKGTSVTKFAILDDNDDGFTSYFDSQFIKVDQENGLTEKEVLKAVALIGKEKL